MRQPLLRLLESTRLGPAAASSAALSAAELAILRFFWVKHHAKAERAKDLAQEMCGRGRVQNVPWPYYSDMQCLPTLLFSLIETVSVSLSKQFPAAAPRKI